MFRLTLLFVGFKLLQGAIIYFTPAQFDISSEVVLSQCADEASKVPSILVKFAEQNLVWDNVYYIHLARDGPQYEHEYVFSPGWWRVIHYVCTNWLSSTNIYVLILTGIVISNLCQYLACIEIFWYTKHVLGRVPLLRHKRRLGYLAALAYMFSPGGVFLTTSYSENICSLAAITGLFLRELALDYRIQFRIRLIVLYVLSGFVMGASYVFRANCLLLGIFYLFDLFQFLRQKSIKGIILSIIGGSPLLLNFVAQSWYNYVQFCPGRGEWCYNKIPLLFSYAQSKYWNNGFLNYWTPNNIPNFLIASPIILLNFNSCICFLRTYPVQAFIPYVLLNCLLLIGGIFFLNVQILNRILNFNPIFYWYVALQLEPLSKNEPFISKNRTSTRTIIKMLNRIANPNSILVGTILWILVQTALFAAFLPPA